MAKPKPILEPDVSDVVAVSGRIAMLTRAEIQVIQKNDEAPVLERLIAGMLDSLLETNDAERVQSLLFHLETAKGGASLRTVPI